MITLINETEFRQRLLKAQDAREDAFLADALPLDDTTTYQLIFVFVRRRYDDRRGLAYWDKATLCFENRNDPRWEETDSDWLVESTDLARLAHLTDYNLRAVQDGLANNRSGMFYHITSEGGYVIRRKP
ncbi:hypothetical protein [Rhizobium sp. BK251]|uniref:hypothetical protein n=1 Tax=Rhizobium sp. BK251 TaxID=2512125 RepID=UPI001045BD6B|nr:hypothetical protein [Rhizobium sp. BK251]TCL70460.1 hypothetical protein EV286_107334 [Rhizobium sp. BK251]